MAIVVIDQARAALKRLSSLGGGARKRLKAVLKQLEDNPLQFRELEDVAISLPPGMTLRKVKVTGHKYDWRLILIHYEGPDGGVVHVFHAFERKTGYQIDWDAVVALLAEEGE